MRTRHLGAVSRPSRVPIAPLSSSRRRRLRVLRGRPRRGDGRPRTPANVVPVLLAARAGLSGLVRLAGTARAPGRRVGVVEATRAGGFASEGRTAVTGALPPAPARGGRRRGGDDGRAGGWARGARGVRGNLGTSLGGARQDSARRRDHAGEPFVRPLFRHLSRGRRDPNGQRRPDGLLARSEVGRVRSRRTMTRASRMAGDRIRCRTRCATSTTGRWTGSWRPRRADSQSSNARGPARVTM